MASQTPEQIAQAWATNLGRSGEKIKAGIRSVSESPTQGAIRALPLARQNYNDAIDSGRTADALGRVTLQQWQAAMEQKGIPRIASGATAAQPKFTQFMQRFLPVANAVSQQVKNMPKGTLQDSLNRVAVAITAFKQFANKPV